MLKRYTEPDRIRWSGKAWEIRAALRILERQKGGSARLKELLPEIALPAPRLEGVRRR
ncbi:Z-ring formation inhibitor MciZ [Cohnella sp. GbtcB17]|uniref:Z-ring formation inhibitor MciZ n=1 Tax=Cohnella sp. GbtcB17 TaxID=2824762 RepID=UPI001C2F6D58|nr:Z-ring formation inhibitor MciZ [Cohnella sp. GbtcB17]